MEDYKIVLNEDDEFIKEEIKEESTTEEVEETMLGFKKIFKMENNKEDFDLLSKSYRQLLKTYINQWRKGGQSAFDHIRIKFLNGVLKEQRQKHSSGDYKEFLDLLSETDSLFANYINRGKSGQFKLLYLWKELVNKFEELGKEYNNTEIIDYLTKDTETNKGVEECFKMIIAWNEKGTIYNPKLINNEPVINEYNIATYKFHKTVNLYFVGYPTNELTKEGVVISEGEAIISLEEIKIDLEYTRFKIRNEFYRIERKLSLKNDILEGYLKLVISLVKENLTIE